MVAKEDIGKKVYFLFGGTTHKGVLKEFFNDFFCRVFFDEKKINVICHIKNVFTNKRQMIKFICDSIPSKTMKNIEYIENHLLLTQEEKNIILNQDAVYIITNYGFSYGILMATRIRYKYSYNDSETIAIKPSYDFIQYYDLNSNVMEMVDKNCSKVYNTREELLINFSRKIKEL